jgi:RNA polymerase sigma-70 factor (ECF subfamily)
VSSEPRPSLVLVPASGRDALFADWLPTVTQWCRRLGGPSIDADDAAQDVMLVVMRRVDELRAPEARATWIFAVTRRVLAAHRRRAWLRRWTGFASPELPDPTPGADRALDDHGLAVLIDRALARLSAPHRELIVLVDVEGRSVQEAAGIVGVPEGTVKSRLSRARDHLTAAAQHVGLTEERE